MKEIETGRRARYDIYDMSGLKLIFWGLILTAINIRIHGFDLVPDPIGFIMILVGLGKVEYYDPNFGYAKKLAYVLTALSLINVYQAPASSTMNQSAIMGSSSPSMNFSAGIFGGVPWLAIVLMILGFAANIGFAYFLCMGIKKLLIGVGDFALAKICDDRWKFILAAETGLVISLLLTALQVPFGTVLTLVFAVLAFIAMVLFVLLVHHAYKNIHNREINQAGM
jgi:hypothetical protein